MRKTTLVSVVAQVILLALVSNRKLESDQTAQIATIILGSGR